jgi:hypothetical protein
MIPDILEVDPLLSKFLFDYIRYAVDRNDFELFKKTINNASLLNVPNPRSIQNEIHTNLLEKIQPPLFFYNREIIDKILKEIRCFEYLLKYQTIKDFSAVNVLIQAYDIYEKNLEKYIYSITKSEDLLNELAKMYGTDSGGILSMIETTLNSLDNCNKSGYFSIHKHLGRLFISLKLHFTFYRVGAFIIFEGKQKQINSAQYLKELWEHTCPDDACAVICNESSILFEPLWLTYLHFYGGQNIEYWTKTTFDFSLGFDDYHGAENYLYEYYLLTITRCIQQGKGQLDLPKIEELNNLKAKEPYKFKEIYEFANLFKMDSRFLLNHCENLIRDAHQWDLLFNNKAEEALFETKKWIEENKEICDVITNELKKRMNSDNGKISYFSQKVLEGYRNTSIINELAEIKKFDEKTDGRLKFIHIYQHIGNLDKRWFFKDDDSHPDHIFTEFGRAISSGERVHILETIKKVDSVEIITLKEIHASAIFSKIKDMCYQMKNSGHNPSVIFIPIELTKNLVINHFGSFLILKIDENVSLEIVNSNNRWVFDEIVILDKSAGIWTYKPIDNTEERISVEITPNVDNELMMKIIVKTTVNYSIVKPDAAKILKFDLSVTPPSS